MRPAPFIVGIAATLLLLGGAYLGSYYALRPTDPLDCCKWRYDIEHGQPPYFWPAQQVDYLIRRGELPD
jgi:hypothetical protein